MARKFSERQMSMILSTIAYPVLGFPVLCCSEEGGHLGRETVTTSNRLLPLLWDAAEDRATCMQDAEYVEKYDFGYVEGVFERLLPYLERT